MLNSEPRTPNRTLYTKPAYLPSSHRQMPQPTVIVWIRDASRRPGIDLLIHDVQDTCEEFEDRNGWGHSSYDQAIEVAERAGVSLFIMTHNDHDQDYNFHKLGRKTVPLPERGLR